MTIVVDTSVAAKWFVEETGREQALNVLDAPDRHAPDLIIAEVGNVAITELSWLRSPCTSTIS